MLISDVLSLYPGSHCTCHYPTLTYKYYTTFLHLQHLSFIIFLIISEFVDIAFTHWVFLVTHHLIRLTGWWPSSAPQVSHSHLVSVLCSVLLSS